MKRLTERNSNGTVSRNSNNCPVYNCGVCSCVEECDKEIMTRLAVYEDKIESGQLLELPTIISFPDAHPFLGKITAYQVVWLDELLGIRHEKYTTREQAEARLKELWEKL